MASIAITIVGAVLNAAAFTGGNYLAKYIAGDSTRSFLFTDIRHICPRAVFFEDPVDLFRESYTLIYRNFCTSSLMFLELNVQPPLVLLAHRMKM